jgi:hypothetical protein
MVIIGIDPRRECSHQLERAGPFLQPQAFLFQGAHNSLSIGIALRIVVAGKRLMEPQRAAGRHECLSGRLTPVVTHQGHVLASGTIRELAMNGHIQSREPMRRRARTTGVITHDLFGTTSPAPGRCRPSRSPLPTPWSCRFPTTRWAW